MTIEFHHIARSEIKDFAKCHLAAAKPKSGLKLYVEQQLQPGSASLRLPSLNFLCRSFSRTRRVRRGTQLILNHDEPGVTRRNELKCARDCVAWLRGATALNAAILMSGDQQFPGRCLAHLAQKLRPGFHLICAFPQ